MIHVDIIGGPSSLGVATAAEGPTMQETGHGLIQLVHLWLQILPKSNGHILVLKAPSAAAIA